MFTRTMSKSPAMVGSERQKMFLSFSIIFNINHSSHWLINIKTVFLIPKNSVLDYQNDAHKTQV